MAQTTPVALPATSGLVVSHTCSYYGFSVAETTGSATATIRLYDGADATGTLFEVIDLVALESARENYPNAEPHAKIYAAITGSVTGVVRIG